MNFYLYTVLRCGVLLCCERTFQLRTYNNEVCWTHTLDHDCGQQVLYQQEQELWICDRDDVLVEFLDLVTGIAHLATQPFTYWKNKIWVSPDGWMLYHRKVFHYFPAPPNVNSPTIIHGFVGENVVLRVGDWTWKEDEGWVTTSAEDRNMVCWGGQRWHWNPITGMLWRDKAGTALSVGVGAKPLGMKGDYVLFGWEDQFIVVWLRDGRPMVKATRRQPHVHWEEVAACGFVGRGWLVVVRRTMFLFFSFGLEHYRVLPQPTFFGPSGEWVWLEEGVVKHNQIDENCDHHLSMVGR